MPDLITRERDRALTVVTHPSLYRPSYVALCFRFLEQWGV